MVGIEKVDIEKVVGRHLVLSENINVEQYYTKKEAQEDWLHEYTMKRNTEDADIMTQIFATCNTKFKHIFVY